MCHSSCFSKAYQGTPPAVPSGGRVPAFSLHAEGNVNSPLWPRGRDTPGSLSPCLPPPCPLLMLFQTHWPHSATPMAACPPPSVRPASLPATWSPAPVCKAVRVQVDAHAEPSDRPGNPAGHCRLLFSRGTLFLSVFAACDPMRIHKMTCIITKTCTVGLCDHAHHVRCVVCVSVCPGRPHTSSEQASRALVSVPSALSTSDGA